MRVLVDHAFEQDAVGDVARDLANARVSERRRRRVVHEREAVDAVVLAVRPEERAAFEQGLGQPESEKAGGAGYKHMHGMKSIKRVKSMKTACSRDKGRRARRYR